MKSNWMNAEAAPRTLSTDEILAVSGAAHGDGTGGGTGGGGGNGTGAGDGLGWFRTFLRLLLA